MKHLIRSLTVVAVLTGVAGAQGLLHTQQSFLTSAFCKTYTCVFNARPA
ncbi:hypothetical protein [Deinococcus pimensis]|nr:hypothetical protein [Deinococcus pimensis]